MEKRHIPKNLRGKRKKKSLRAATAAFAVCFVLLVFLIGAVIGRYQRQLRSDNSVRAKDFYFTSNFLDGSTHTLAPGSTEVKFTLGNHADDLRFSEVDIEYTVTVDNEAKVNINNTGTNTGTLTTGSVKDAEVILSDLKDGETYNVTATGTGGYSQTLTAAITVLPTAGQLYYHQDNVPGEYLLLTVWNEGEEAGDVTINYTGIPDNTNPNMIDWNTGEGTDQKQTVTIASHSSKVFRFFNGEVKEVTGATAKKLD